MKPQVVRHQQSQITLLGQTLSFETQEIPQAWILAQTQMAAGSRGTWMEMLSQEGLGALMEATLSMAAQLKEPSELLSKLIQLSTDHAKDSCVTINQTAGFFDHQSPDDPALNSGRFPTCSSKICKNPSVRPEFLGGTHTERTVRKVAQWHQLYPIVKSLL